MKYKKKKGKWRLMDRMEVKNQMKKMEEAQEGNNSGI